MESFDSSSNYNRATSRFDANKENSQGGSECDDMVSVTCSTCESTINGSSYAQKLENGIKQRSSSKKTIKNFGKVGSFRRRLIVQSPVPISDEDSLLHSSSPHYLQPTTSSEGKKMTSPHHSESPLSDISYSHPKSFQALSRTSSFRNVRILKKKASFRPKRSSLNYPKVVAVDRATYSSTVKDSKFPDPVELESETSLGVKVCRYHHCSMHGCHGGHDPDPPPKHFLYKKRRSLKKQRSIMPRTESRRGAKNSKGQIVPIVKPSDQERREYKNVEDSHEEKLYNQEGQPLGDGYKDIAEAILVEVAFGETSFPERSYRENLDILRKYSSREKDFGGQFSCSCHNREEVVSTPSRAEADVPLHNVSSFSLDEFSNEIPCTGSTDVSVISSSALFKKPTETPVVSDEVAEKKSAFSSALYSQTSSDGNSEEEIESSRNETGDSKVDEVVQVEDSDTNSPVLTGSTLQFSKPRHISMWNMIHQHLSSNLAAESTNEPLQGTDGSSSPLAEESTTGSDMNGIDNDSETQEIEIRKLFAIKLVREAIEKILLPEVQDPTSDDQSVASESSEIIEKNQSKEVDAEGGEANSLSNPKEESINADDASSGKIRETEEKFVAKTEKKAPKHWSNLKKWILLQRFIRELEKVRKFNPRKPRHLPLNPDPETEKVNLRPQTLNDKKSAEEWMLDYALRQAVSQLAPTQKRKVLLLVKAFETVVPQQDDPQVQIRTPWLRVNSLDVPDQETGIKMINETKNVCHQDKPAFPTLRSLQVDVVSDSIEGKANNSSQTDRKNHIKMWHMIYHHVVSDIAEKVGSQLLDGSEDDEAEQNGDSGDFSNNLRGGLTKSNALKLVKDAVDEILVPEIQDDSSDTQSVTSEGGSSTSKEGEDTKGESQVIKNWGKLKKLILLKRSIRALEKARVSKPQPNQLVPQAPDPEPEKVELRRHMVDERKKAEQWMLDYAVQHIVTKLTPARKRRVSMLVEAFEAVVPIPEM
ncbi:hypothetical protein ACS0TY_025355 [Phlomoides rotata]